MVSITLSGKESMVNGEKNHSKNEVSEEIIEEPDFSDSEGYVDQIDETELLGDILRLKPNEDEIYDKVVVVDNIPEVGTDRLEKLKSVIHRVFAPMGTILSDYFPEKVDPKNESVKKTKGYCFIEYDSKASAQGATSVLNGFSIDKMHKLFVTSFRDFKRLNSIEDPEEWDPPNIRPYKDMGNLRYWLLNPDCLDQFVVQYEGGDKAAVFLNGLTEPTKLVEKQRWSDSFVRWSPFGTYMATVHKQGVVLWGGEKFENINKFSHSNVQFLDFSPAENFIVTYAPPKSRYADSPDAVKIWCIRTGELKHACSIKLEAFKWPKFKWSFDDNYVAVLNKENTLCVYETSGKFTPVKPESDDQKIVNVRDFQWSPSELLIAFWVAEVKQTPGRVGICDTKCKARATKNLFSLADASIHWQKSGDHLCFKTDLYKKKKITEDGEIKYINLTAQLEIFHIREKNVPVSTMEIKEAVLAFNWEPTGTKFALIQGDMKSIVNIYGAKHEPVAAISLLKSLDYRGQVNSLFWSPQGNYLVCAGLKSNTSGPLIFIDCSQEKEVTLLNVQEHQGMTDVEWDPTGRFVVSMISSWDSTSRGLDYGFLVWNFQGRMLARRQMPGFCSFYWRPRPPTLLNEEKIKAIRKNMKKYAMEFDEKDRKKLDKASLEVSDRRRKQLTDFKEWREQHALKFAEFERDRAKLRKELPENNEISEETVEYLVSQEEIVIE